MKKLVALVLLMAVLVPVSFAQKGLHLGANFNYVSSSIVNQNVWGLGHEYDYEMSYNPGFGLDVGYHFNDKIGVYTGFWSSTLGQSYTDEYEAIGSESMSSWERELKFKYNVIPLMLRFTKSERKVNFIGGFGVSFAFMSEAEQTWTQDGKTYNPELVNPITEKKFMLGQEDVTDRYVKSDIFINLELGARIFVMDHLYVDASFYGGYGLKDINDENWQMENNDGEYKASHNAFGGIKIGVAYVLFGEY